MVSLWGLGLALYESVVNEKDEGVIGDLPRGILEVLWGKAMPAVMKKWSGLL